MHCLRWALFGFIYLGCAAAVAWRNAAVGDPAARASVWLPFAGWYLKMQKGKNKEPDKDRRQSWPSSKAKSLSASLNTSWKASVLLCPLLLFCLASKKRRMLCISQQWEQPAPWQQLHGDCVHRNPATARLPAQNASAVCTALCIRSGK